MAESIVQVNEGSGKKLHTFQRTIGANTVEDEVMLSGEPYLATYFVSSGLISIATANSHILQIMAGASLNVYIRRLLIWQSAAVTTAAFASWQLLRLTSAGTGGAVPTSAALDSGDAAAGAAAMTLPTVKGTEGAVLATATPLLIQTIPVGGPAGGSLIVDLDFDKQLRAKMPRIPAGAANGLALKWLTANAAGQVTVTVYYSEANF